MELLDRYLENTLVFLDKSQVRGKIVPCDKNEILWLTVFKAFGDALCIVGILGKMLI